MTKMTTIIIDTICLALVIFSRHVQSSNDCSANVTSNHFRIFRCSDPDYQGVLMSSPVQETVQRTVLECAVSCNHDVQCDYAIFRGTVDRCIHTIAPKSTSTQEAHPYTNEAQCKVIWKYRAPLTCQNGGKPGDYICKCPKNYVGRECEKQVPDFCLSGNWREVSLDEYQMLVSSFLQVKFIRASEDGLTTVLPVRYIGVREGVLIFASQEFLAVDPEDENFQTPLQREFHFYTSHDSTLTTVLVRTVTGETTSSAVVIPAPILMVRDVVDDDRLFFQSHQTNPANDLVDGLANGYRLMWREPCRVGFDRAIGLALSQTVRISMGLSNTAVIRPMYYYSAQHSTTKDAFILRTRIEDNLGFWNNNAATQDRRWELDRCWIMVDPTLDCVIFTNVLKEYILQGREVRLVMEGRLSTDVTRVTLTNTDVIVTLTDFLTPFDHDKALNASSKVAHMVISRSKVQATCKKTFQGSDVFLKESKNYYNTLEWYVSSRPVSKVLTVGPQGQVIFGSSVDVYNAATSGKEIRVCVSGLQGQTVCTGSTTVYYENVDADPSVRRKRRKRREGDTGDDKQVVVQTPGTMMVDTDSDGKFLGISGTDCDLTVILMSTNGWIKMAFYTIGVENSYDDFSSLDFLTMTWFVQQ